MALGAYSSTAMPANAGTSIQTPLACPNFNVFEASLLTNVFSTAASSGLYLVKTFDNFSKIHLSLTARLSEEFVSQIPFATSKILSPFVSIIPHPVFLKPGSIPIILITPQ